MSFRSYLDVSNVWTNDRSTILPAEINVSGTYDFWAAYAFVDSDLWVWCQMSHAGNLDRFLGRKNMLTHMLAHPYAIGGFSYAGIWAFYGLTQGLRESKSPQSHLFSWHVPYAAFFATEYFSASFIICRIRRWRCWRRGCWGRAWTVSFQCCLLRSTLSSLLFGAYGAIRAMGRRFGAMGQLFR